jgi:predicted SAM-dependent methyltransferase
MAATLTANRLNFACGYAIWPGFDNSDISGEPGSTYLDLEDFPYRYEDDSAEIIMMSHALFVGEEGVPAHPDFAPIMAECYRILEPGGWLRIDDNPFRCYVDGVVYPPDEAAREHMARFPSQLKIPRETLREILRDAGFKRVEDVPQGMTLIPGDAELHQAIIGNRLTHVSFTIEAQK